MQALSYWSLTLGLTLKENALSSGNVKSRQLGFNRMPGGPQTGSLGQLRGKLETCPDSILKTQPQEARSN